MPNLELEKKRDVSAFRKIALGTWRTAYDPSVYGTIELKMDAAMDYIGRFRAATGKHLTVTHLLARAVAETLRKVPDANSILRFNRVYLRKRIGIFMQVVMTDQGADKIDLSGVTIYDVADKNLEQIADEVQQKVDKVRAHKDPALEKSRGMFRFIPYLLLNAFLRFVSWLSYTLNLDLRWAGIPSDPFGSVMITNIGTLGLEMAYVPLVPYARVPILLATGEVKEQPVVEEGEITIRKLMKVNATFDHRFIDGFHAAAMSRTLRAWMEEPERFFGPIPAGPGAEAAREEALPA
jgi:pyruvate/2-oxoglutarate dehydrogenase complex dihydrolipoamide acyltransferase (E2) component